jgi:uncharacterized protein YndB with AHSA1/START domain
MSESSVDHAIFTLERRYAAPPREVFAAWSEPAAKSAWFAPNASPYSLDFRIDGEERVVTAMPDGRELSFTSRYHDIVPEERIVYSSVLATDGQPATISITSVQFLPGEAGAGTRLVLSEQDTFLDGQEKPEWRETGTGAWLDALGRAIGASIS